MTSVYATMAIAFSNQAESLEETSSDCSSATEKVEKPTMSLTVDRSVYAVMGAAFARQAKL